MHVYLINGQTNFTAGICKTVILQKNDESLLVESLIYSTYTNKTSVAECMILISGEKISKRGRVSHLLPPPPKRHGIVLTTRSISASKTT